MMFSRRIDEELELRPVDERYAEELTSLVRRDLAHLRPWMPWATERYSVEDAREFIRRQVRQYAEDMGFATPIFFRGRARGGFHPPRVSQVRGRHGLAHALLLPRPRKKMSVANPMSSAYWRTWR